MCRVCGPRRGAYGSRRVFRSHFASFRKGASAIVATATNPGSALAGLFSDEALKIARLDAERAYRDLTPYRIGIVLEADGWHVDFELKNPALNSGGPHYLIDPRTGLIVAKRYEQ